MAMETAQINTRISRTLKESGDAALERAGYSPSQAIRKLWSFAARNLHNPQAIQQVLDAADTSDATEQEERARKLTNLQAGFSACAHAYQQVGVEPSSFTTEASYDELRERALFERFTERGSHD